MFLYDCPVSDVIVIMVAVASAVGGLALARRFVLPHIKYDDSVNDAISGALGVIGVFYGITIGLIAIEVWQRHSSAEEIVAREAAAIYTLYLMAREDYHTTSDPAEKPIAKSNAPDTAEPTPAAKKLTLAAKKVSEYLYDVICVAWEEQRKGTMPGDWKALRDIRTELASIEPKTEGAKVRYAATIQSLNDLSEVRRMRVDAADDKISGRMWTIIICGAVMNIFAIYLLQFKDVKLHYAVVSLSSGLLGIVLLIILLNNKPFLGDTGIEPDSYIQVSWIISSDAFNEFNGKGWREACDRIRRQTGGAVSVR